MPVELEAKMKIEDVEAVRRRLEEIGAKSAGEVLETNIFFDTDDRSLLARDHGLRLRINHDVATGKRTYIITFKGPRMQGVLKTRDETELEVQSDADAVALLACLGFRQMMSFEKKRRTWKHQACNIELDELPYLGTFVEVEGPDSPTVLKVRESLGLAHKPMIQAGYISLLTAHLQEEGNTNRVIKFPAK